MANKKTKPVKKNGRSIETLKKTGEYVEATVVPDEKLIEPKKMFSGKGKRLKGVTSINKWPEGYVSPNEARFLENRFLRGMTIADAARDAKICVTTNENSLVTAGSKIIRKHRDNPNSAFAKALKARGISVDLLAEKIEEGLNSVQFIKIRKGKDEDELVEKPDQFARHRYVETTIDILGARAPKQVEVQNLTFEQRLLQLTIDDKREDKLIE